MKLTQPYQENIFNTAEKEIEAMNQFKVVPKPQGLLLRNGKYDALITAIKNVGNDKSVVVPNSYLDGRKLPQLKAAIKIAAKARFNLKVTVVEIHGTIYAFRSAGG